ncbi:MAG: hypothetical protein Q9159_006826 [Coniocarpon cinnabarinum]
MPQDSEQGRLSTSQPVRPATNRPRWWSEDYMKLRSVQDEARTFALADEAAGKHGKWDENYTKSQRHQHGFSTGQRSNRTMTSYRDWSLEYNQPRREQSRFSVHQSIDLAPPRARPGTGNFMLPLQQQRRSSTSQLIDTAGRMPPRWSQERRQPGNEPIFQDSEHRHARRMHSEFRSLRSSQKRVERKVRFADKCAVVFVDDYTVDPPAKIRTALMHVSPTKESSELGVRRYRKTPFPSKLEFESRRDPHAGSPHDKEAETVWAPSPNKSSRTDRRDDAVPERHRHSNMKRRERNMAMAQPPERHAASHRSHPERDFYGPRSRSVGYLPQYDRSRERLPQGYRQDL